MPLCRFLEQLRTDLDFAYVVIMHLAPDHSSALGEILSASTKMPVETVTATKKLQPNHVYVIASGSQLKEANGFLLASAFDRQRGHRAPIDYLLKSMALNRDNSVGVLFSGGGMDGAEGTLAIKESGGVMCAQSPDEAEHADLPRAAIETGAVDFIGTVTELADHIAVLSERGESVAVENIDTQSEKIGKIIRILRKRVGHDFSQYKQATVLRRIERRMHLNNCETLDEYVDFLQDSEGEAKDLFGDLLISVTSFFRNPEAFDVLATDVIVPLFDRLEHNDTSEIRVWSVGCATGEEAYSLAILLTEEAERRKLHANIQIFATDIDDKALMIARNCVYGAAIEDTVSPERLQRHFIKEGDNWRVRKELRDMILFSQHSVLRDPPFLHLDILACRNLLIYLDRQTQLNVCGIFGYALKPNGAIMLGSAETVSQSPEIFQSLDHDQRIFTAKPSWAPRLSNLQEPAQRLALPSDSAFVRNAIHEQSIITQHLNSLEKVTPPNVMVGSDHRVQHLSPEAGQFLLPSGGVLSSELPALARPELRLDIKDALNRAFDRGEPTLALPVDVDFGGHRRRIAIHVSPGQIGKGQLPHALVLFIDCGPALKPADAPDNPESKKFSILQEELRASQLRLALSRSEHELATQELRAANEELQSTNEEYRSTSEELETSKEELQSMNEELETVNAELSSKLDSVSSAHSDLRNVVDSSDLGTLFLDDQLKIRMFTPRVKEVFHVTSGDVGRPITDFSHKFKNGTVHDHAAEVLRSLVPVEMEDSTSDGRWFTIRYQPYRTIDERIDGVVVTFIDTTSAHLANEIIRTSEERFATLLRATTDVAFRMGPDWAEMRALHSGAFLAASNGPRTDWLEAYVPKGDHKLYRSAIDRATSSKSLFELEHRVFRHDGSIGWALARAAPIFDKDGSIREWFGIASDVTSRKDGEQAQGLLAELNHRVKNMLTVILSISEQTRGEEKTIDAFADTFESRIFALADAHDALTQTGWKGADLQDLARRATSVFTSTERQSISISGPEVALRPNSATSLSLALHELCTNATKHGSLSSPKGRVDLAWHFAPKRKNKERSLILEWLETGGAPVVPPTRRGFGVRLLEEGMPNELNGVGQITYSAEGLTYRLEVPFPDSVEGLG